MRLTGSLLLVTLCHPVTLFDPPKETLDRIIVFIRGIFWVFAIIVIVMLFVAVLPILLS